jgi:pyruvate dehydrogenase E2 component (dihydrolipoamide acetyltransferase)
MAEERGIDLRQLQGTGDHGRIVRRDIENYVPRQEAPAQEAPASSAPAAAPEPPPAAPMPAMEEGYEDVKLSQMRKTIARRLSDSKFTAPHFYLKMEINMDQAWESRKQINDFLGFKVSFNDMIVKAVAAALRRHPAVNVSWMEDRLRYHKHIHIGVAVAVPEGLIVPVIRHADALSLSAISQQTRSLAERARQKKLQPEEFQGNTFSVSNLGMYDIDEFTGIINPPDACILTVGKIKEAPVVEDGQMRVAKLMKVSLSCDHRAVDGATGAEFLQTFKALLENPVRLIA